MKRLTKIDKYGHPYTNENVNCRNLVSEDGVNYQFVEYENNVKAYDGKPIDKLYALEEIETDLGIPLEVLFKALKQGYIWVYDTNGYYKVSIINLTCYIEEYENGEDEYIWEFAVKYIENPVGVRDKLCGIALRNYNFPSKFYRWWLEKPIEESE